MKHQINDIERGEVANCISLHDFANMKPDLRIWTQYVIDFFKKYNILPSKISSPAKTTTKNILFQNGIRQLEKLNYQVEHIWIGALPPDHNSDIFSAIFTANIRFRDSRTYCGLIFDNEITGFDTKEINQIAVELSRLVKAKYGYVYQRDFNKGPTWYPYGVISGLERGEPERKLITKWQDAYCMPDGEYKTGDLRDIYPINYLSRAHIDRMILGIRFADWIKSDINHGYLEQLDEDFWSWQVEFDQIDSVREKLRHTGMILCI